MSRPAEAIINLANISNNFAFAKGLASDARVMAVIKANAYGHGAVPVAMALTEADAFGVASLAEAVELREAGVDKPLVLLGGFFDSATWHYAEQYDLQLVIGNQFQLDGFLGSKPENPSKPVTIWLKVDTGMHRLGFPPQAFAKARQSLIESGRIKELIIMSHLACADDDSNPMTDSQLMLFNKLVGDLPESKSLANSAALMQRPDTHCDWVRPGIMLYGANPLRQSSQAEGRMSPAMTLRSSLVDVRAISAGDSVGYDQQWHATGPAKIGTVAIGYGDGYPRHAANGTPVLVGGRRACLVGRVSMDFISIDLSDQPEAKTGDEVVLWGEGLPVEEVAKMADTISYELLTGVRSRVKRRYVE